MKIEGVYNKQVGEGGGEGDGEKAEGKKGGGLEEREEKEMLLDDIIF